MSTNLQSCQHQQPGKTHIRVVRWSVLSYQFIKCRDDVVTLVAWHKLSVSSDFFTTPRHEERERKKREKRGKREEKEKERKKEGKKEREGRKKEEEGDKKRK